MQPEQGEDLQAYLKTLASEGVTHSDGHFTLDEKRADELLARYQIHDPESFAVRLVAAAVAGGARRIEVTWQDSNFHMTFDGQPYLPEELRHAQDTLFLDGSVAAVARRQELVLALQAATRLGFTGLELSSRGPQGGVGWKGSLQGGLPEVHGLPASSVASTEIALLWPGEKAWLDRWRGGTRGAPIERIEELIRERCGWAPARVILQGRPLAFPAIPRQATMVTLLKSKNPVKSDLTSLRQLPSLGSLDRAIALFESPAPHQITIVQHGVACTLDWELDAWAVAYVPRLRRDLSSARPLESELEPIFTLFRQEYARHVVDLCRNYADLPESSVGEMRYALLKRLERLDNDRSLGPEDRQIVLAALESAPLFPLLGNGRASLSDLRACLEQRQTVLFTESLWPDSVSYDQPVVVAREFGVANALRQNFGGTLENADYLLVGPGDNLMRRNRFQASPSRAIEVPGHHWSVVDLPSGFQEQGWRGQATLGGRADASTLSVYLFHQERLLEERQIPTSPSLGGISLALEHPGFRPQEEWEGFLANPELERSFERIAEAVRRPLLLQAACYWGVGLAPSEQMRRELLDIWEADAPPQLRSLTLFPLAVPRSAYRQEEVPTFEEPVLLGGLASDSSPLLGAPPDSAVDNSLPRPEDAWDNHNISWGELVTLRERLGYLPVARIPSPLPPSGGELVVLCPRWLSPFLQPLEPWRDFDQELESAEKRHLQQKRGL